MLAWDTLRSPNSRTRATSHIPKHHYGHKALLKLATRRQNATTCVMKHILSTTTHFANINHYPHGVQMGGHFHEARIAC